MVLTAAELLETEEAEQVGFAEMDKFSKKKNYLIAKRILDIILSFAGLIVCAIPMMVVSLLIRLESPGPALFMQKRMGKDGKVFVMYKFRTMYTSAPGNLATRTFSNAGQYITPLGKVLRRTSIDEIPQLVNILRGDMSIVGCRPVCLTEERLNNLRMERGVFALRPGLTGLAQISGRDNLSVEEKVELEVRYLNECSLKLDAWCIIKTVFTVITGEGVL